MRRHQVRILTNISTAWRKLRISTVSHQHRRAHCSIKSVVCFPKSLSTRRTQQCTHTASVMGNIFDMENVPISRDQLRAQDSVTSSLLISKLKEEETFVSFSKKARDDILARDNEDAEKLARGIQTSIEKGVLEKIDPAPYTQVDVLGKTADDVAKEIIGHLGADYKGGVLVLVGLSGTGKGTTVDTLKKTLANSTTWSNGNVFRALTLLAATHCTQQGTDFDSSSLTTENLASWMSMLKFGKFNGKFDIHINGMGLDMYVDDVKNTTLKGPLVGKNIPTVAEVTQGEVVKFANGACKMMGEAGMTVLLEGREQTVNYIESPFRFELIMSDTKIIGMRRAAQLVGARAIELLGAAADEADVDAAVKLALSQLVLEK